MSHMLFYPSLFIYGFSVVCLILTYIFESITSGSGPRLFVGNFSFKIQAKFCSFPHCMDIFGGPWSAKYCCRCWEFIIIQLVILFSDHHSLLLTCVGSLWVCHHCPRAAPWWSSSREADQPQQHSRWKSCPTGGCHTTRWQGYTRWGRCFPRPVWGCGSSWQSALPFGGILMCTFFSVHGKYCFIRLTLDISLVAYICH